MPDFVRVASASSLADGEMRQVTAGETDVLLSRVDGRFHACTAFCTHYGAPLATGVLSGTTVVCPWHHAVFDVASGARDEPPALDSLRTFEVRVDGDDVLVRVPDDADEHGKDVAYRESDGRERGGTESEADDRLFLILGAGAAAQAAAEELRACGFRGRLALVTRETRAPYDRTALSKGYLGGKAGDEALPLRDAAFYERHAIEVWTDRTVESLDADAKQASFSEGEPIAYDACLVATGGVPRRLPIDGADLDGVFLLRTWNDARTIVQQAEGAKRAVVIGTAFIGMEAASNLNDRGLDVIVVGTSDAPFETAMGAEVGRVFQKAAEEKGVQFRLGATVERIEETDSGLRIVVDGDPVDTDLVLVGVGVDPATEFVAGAPFRRDDGGLVVDEHLRLADGLFAAGDIAAYPDPRSGETVRIEHWRLAQQHGRTAARNMLASGDPTLRPEPFDGVPFFWTGQFGLSLRYVGHAEEWDEVVIDGSLGDRQFLAAYVHDGAVRALAAVGRDKDAAAFHLLMAQGRTPTPDEIRGGLDLQARLAER